jgi:excisionase family DNA binding protein
MDRSIDHRRENNPAKRGDVLAVSVAETARLLGLSREAAYQAVRRGQLPAVRIGRRILVPWAALEQLLQGGGSRHA